MMGSGYLSSLLFSPHRLRWLERVLAPWFRSSASLVLCVMPSHIHTLHTIFVISADTFSTFSFSFFFFFLLFSLWRLASTTSMEGGGGGEYLLALGIGRESCTTTTTSTGVHSEMRRGIPWDVDDSTTVFLLVFGWDTTGRDND